jgi:hypothetical protein
LRRHWLVGNEILLLFAETKIGRAARHGVSALNE